MFVSTRVSLILSAAIVAGLPLLAARGAISPRPVMIQDEGRTYFVATDGDDNAAGTETEPFRTIQRAAQLARAGDTILLRPGVYRSRVVLRHSGERGRPITLKGEPGERPVIELGEMGKRPQGQGILLQAREGHNRPIGWINIEGIEVRQAHDGIKLYNAHDIAIRDCVLKDNWNQGILGTGSRVLVDRCEISGNGTAKEGRENLLHGVYATGSGWTITNNLIHSNSAYGIQVAGKEYDDRSHAGTEFADAKDWVIANNTLAFNKLSSGVVLWQKGVENCLIQNNIFYRNGSVTGITFYGQKDRRHLVRNNLFFPVGKHMKTKDRDTHEEVDNVFEDPRFQDAESFDFHLRRGSPAIDAGVTTRAPKFDFDGKPRPQGDRVDIGAFEAVP